MVGENSRDYIEFLKMKQEPMIENQIQSPLVRSKSIKDKIMYCCKCICEDCTLIRLPKSNVVDKIEVKF